MVRFIAAITVVTVCCCSSAVQAQTKSPAKRPVAPVSRAQQVDDSPSRAQIELKNEHLNQDVQPLPPELEQLLRDWAAASAKIQRLEGEHLRRVYDLTYEVEKLSQGRFFYETPDKGRINITPVEGTEKMKAQRASGKVPTKKRKDGTPFDLKPDQEECWSCDGLRVYELDVAQKQARVAKLPADMQGKNIMDSPLPFLFGMPPEKAKRRFAMSLMRPLGPIDPEDPRPPLAFLHIEPRLPQDAGNWANADVILNRKTFLPEAVQLVDPAGTKITVYSFSSLKVNENKFIDSLFDKQDPKTRFTPDLRGFNVHLQDGGEPAQIAENEPTEPDAKQVAPQKPPALVNVQGMKHSDAVIQLERQGLKRVKEDPEANNIILEAGPAAETEKDIFTVQSQDPPAGTPLKKGMKVRLTIWTKPDGNAKQ